MGGGDWSGSGSGSGSESEGGDGDGDGSSDEEIDTIIYNSRGEQGKNPVLGELENHDRQSVLAASRLGGGGGLTGRRQ